MTQSTTPTCGLLFPSSSMSLSSLLVSMTVFEFISAQAPRTTQGLLIGLWYATFSIRYLVVGILNQLIIERRSWLLCEGVMVFLILVSLVLFSCIQTLSLPTARRDSQCAGNDWRHSWEVVRPGGGVYARAKIVLSNHQSLLYRSAILNCFNSNVVTERF